MVPLILAGAAATRLVATPIARLLIRRNLAKETSKSAKNIIETPITHMNQLPKNLQQAVKSSVSERSPAISTGKRTTKEATSLMERTRKNRQQIQEAAKGLERKPSIPLKIRRNVEAQAKIDEKIASQSAQRLKGAQQQQGSLSKASSGQKRMRLPRKGETVNRRKGGIARKTRVF